METLQKIALTIGLMGLCATSFSVIYYAQGDIGSITIVNGQPVSSKGVQFKCYRKIGGIEEKNYIVLEHNSEVDTINALGWKIATRGKLLIRGSTTSVIIHDSGTLTEEEAMPVKNIPVKKVFAGLMGAISQSKTADPNSKRFAQNTLSSNGGLTANECIIQ